MFRIPKFTNSEIPTADYLQLPERHQTLRAYVEVAIPRFAILVGEGLVPPMEEPGLVNYMIVERIRGDSLEAALRDSSLSTPAVERFLEGLAEYLSHALTSHEEYIADLFHLDQYMYGKSGQAPGALIWLTDIEPQYLRLPPDVAYLRAKVHLIQVAELIKSLLLAERTAGVSLSRARRALKVLCEAVATNIDSTAASELVRSLEDNSLGDYFSSSWLRRSE